MLVVAGPTGDYIQPEVDAIKKYVEGGGRALFMLDPPLKLGRRNRSATITRSVRSAGELGRYRGQRICCSTKAPLRNCWAAVRKRRVIMQYDSHPIVNDLTNISTALPDLALARNQEHRQDHHHANCSPLPADSFATTNLGSAEIRIDPNKDKHGPFTLAVAGTYTPEAKPSESGRFVVVGNSRWASNQSLGFSGNRNLVLNMVNWLSSDEDLIAIRPKEPEDRRINLTRAQFRMVQTISQFLLPLIVIVRRRDGLAEEEIGMAMRIRGLLVAVVLLAALGGRPLFFEQQKAAEAAKPPADQPPKIVSLTEGDITQNRRSRKRARDRNGFWQKAGGKWAITAPMPYTADQDAANQLVSAGGEHHLRSRRRRQRFQLVRPTGSMPRRSKWISPARAARSASSKFGDDTPTNSGAYAMLEGDPRVFTVASYVKTGLDKSVNDLRDKRLLTFDQDKLSRVELIARAKDRISNSAATRISGRSSSPSRCAPTARRWTR